MRWILVSVALLAASCTTTSTSSSPEPTIDGTSVPPSSTAPGGTTLADGSPLPDGCHGKAVPSETVAFAAEGRAWALDPDTGSLACLFDVADPGAFAFGPQGDRALLADMQVQGVSADAPTWPPKGRTPSVFDWGHPLGLAIVYAEGADTPLKRFMDDGHVERLPTLPDGTYQSIVYHPSGLALGFIVDEGDRQGIWLSSNEGKDPVRLVFSKPDTVFSSLAFSPDGTQIWWIAQHAGAISRDPLDGPGRPDRVRHDPDPRARADRARLVAGALGAVDRRHARGGLRRPAGDDRRCRRGPSRDPRTRADPTQALGWLDASTLLVSVGGCDQPAKLFVVDAAGHGNAMALVDGVDIGAPRTVLHDAPTEVPAPPNEAPPAPPGGVG